MMPGPSEVGMAQTPTIQVGRVTVRALTDEDSHGRRRWRAEWYPEGGGGRMATRSLGRCLGDEAEVRAAELLAQGLELADPGARDTGGAQVETVRDLLAYWLGEQMARLERGEIADRTYIAYRGAVQRLVGQPQAPLPLRDVRLQALTSRRARAERDRRLAQGDAASSIRYDLAMLRSAMVWGDDLGLCDASRMEVPEVRAEDRAGKGYQKRTPTHDEIEQVHAELAVPWHSRLHLLLWHTGARVSEALGATWADVDREAGLVRLDGKTGARRVPVSAEVLDAMAPGIGGAHLVGEEAPSRASASFHHALSRACERAGVTRYSAHGLRRRRTVDLMESGVRPAVYEALMGHSWAMGVRDYDLPQVEDLHAAARKVRR